MDLLEEVDLFPDGVEEFKVVRHLAQRTSCHFL